MNPKELAKNLAEISKMKTLLEKGEVPHYVLFSTAMKLAYVINVNEKALDHPIYSCDGPHSKEEAEKILVKLREQFEKMGPLDL